MALRKKVGPSAVLVALAILSAIYFALFGRDTPHEKDFRAMSGLAAETGRVTEAAPPQESIQTTEGAEKRFADPAASDIERRALAEQGQKRLEKTLRLEPDPAHIVFHEVRSGELLASIAKKYPSLHGEWGLLALVNRIRDPDRLRAGKKLLVPKGTWSLFADKSMFRLWLLYEGTPYKEYTIAIGKDDKTPAVKFRVRSKTPRPTWYPPAELGLSDNVIAYGDPRNPLGEYWIALEREGFEGFGIHGTNDESVIGTAVSNGCLRMHNDEVVEMAAIAYGGMEVTIVE